MLTFLMSLTDEQSRTHIEQTYRKYHEKMLRMAYRHFARARRNNPESDAQDAVQAAFLNIVRYAHAVPFEKSEKELEAYVFTILLHEIDKMLAEPEMFLENSIDNVAEEESAYTLDERISIYERYHEVVATIRDMEPRYSTVLLLCCAEGMTVQQAAKVLGIPSSTVYTRLRRGKQQLIEKFAKEDVK